MKRNCDARGSMSMKFACGILGLTLGLIGPGAWGQTGESASTEKGSTASRQDVVANARVDSRPFQTFYLANAAQANDGNEIVVAVRNLLPPDVKVLYVSSQNALTVRGSSDELAQVQKIISDLDRAKKTYRLTFTTTETDGSKRVGVQHFAMVVVAGQRTVMKQGSKVPIATGSYNATGNTGGQTQFTYIDVGMNFDVNLDELANGVRLRSKVEQLGIAEQTSGLGSQDPIIRQSLLEGTSFLTLGKPLVLGSIDIPGSTRHVDVEVMVEMVAK
jgi:type II secretory pathway component GspD/PulD (secretin)